MEKLIVKNKSRRKVKKLRSQILHKWLTDNYKSTKALDIGGGKGFLAYLLNQSGWQTTVVDPVYQTLPLKYKNLEKKRFKISPEESVNRVTSNFEIEMAQDFNLLIGLHAHGSNMKIVDAAFKFKKDFLILPCCVIDEPIIKQPGINWRDSLEEYALSKRMVVKKVKLNFVGKDIALYTDTYLEKIKPS